MQRFLELFARVVLSSRFLKLNFIVFFSLNGDICVEHQEQIPESLRERLVNSPFQCPFGGLGEMLQIVGEFHKTIFFFPLIPENRGQ